MTKAITEVSLDKNENEILTNGEKPQLLKQPFQPTHPIEYWIKLYQENYEQMLSKGVHEPNSAGWISLLKRLQSVTDEQVEIAKARIRQLVTESEPGTYDERLIEEHMVERRIRHYLAREKKFEENLQIMIDSIQYKNGFLHNYTDDSCFPREFIEFGLFTISGLDRYGSPVLHVIGRHIFANRQLLKLAEPYLAYVLFRVEKLAMATSGTSFEPQPCGKKTLTLRHCADVDLTNGFFHDAFSLQVSGHFASICRKPAFPTWTWTRFDC